MDEAQAHRRTGQAGPGGFPGVCRLYEGRVTFWPWTWSATPLTRMMFPRRSSSRSTGLSAPSRRTPSSARGSTGSPTTPASTTSGSGNSPPPPAGDEVLESRAHGEVSPAWSAAPGPTRAAPLRPPSSRLGSPAPWDRVSPQEKAVFLLRHYDELRLKEIAEALHLSIGSVKSYLFRAIRKLQKELGSPGAAGMEVFRD